MPEDLMPCPGLEDLDIPQGRLYGPCSGRDLPVAFQLAEKSVERFTFCDLAYGRRGVTAGYAVPTEWSLVSRISGRDERQPAKLTWYCERPVQPWVTVETWRRRDGSDAIVELRCDLAQDALLEQFAPRSISVLMHINDGAGEGGSDLWFLAAGRDASNTTDRGQRLLEAVASRLVDGAIVVTDARMAEENFGRGRQFECSNVWWRPLGTIPDSGRAAYPIWLWRAEHLTTV